MYFVKFPATTEETVKKSRFIGAVVPCSDERDVLAALARLAKEHPAAHHLAFAFRLKTASGLVARCSDAGEPSGTAGRPILLHVEGKELVNVLVAVVRYFGGVKLGTGGLTRAYGNAAKRAIEACTRVPFVERRDVVVEIGYDRLQALQYALTKLDGEIKDETYTDRVKLTIRLPAHHIPALREQFGV